MGHRNLVRGRDSRRIALALAVAAMLTGRSTSAQPAAQAALDPDVRAQVDRAATRILARMGVPSVSIAIVKGGQIAYLQAYGHARVGDGSAPDRPARPTMRYGIGSISKQFTATAVLMLAEDGKLSLDDKVAKYLPQLTRAGDVTIRQLLSHTSGYQDYWPQDYVPPFMLRDVTSGEILARWAERPLDFEPGTKWQYSNTAFVAAGAIVEKAGGEPLLQLLRERVFVPLGMQSVLDVDREWLREPDPVGYTRYALGPLRVAPKEGQGRLYAAGELAMTAEDLAKWDVAVADRRLLKPGSYDEMQTPVKLAGGESSGYGLGIGVGTVAGHRSQLSENANSYFDGEALRDFSSSLGPLGAIDEFVPTARNDRGGMTFRAYRVGLGEKSVVVTVRVLPDGKIEQYQVGPSE